MSKHNKLYIFCGLPFSGKSTVTKLLAEQKGFTRIDLDEVKFSMYGGSIKDKDLKQEDWDIIYQEMYRQIEQALKAGETVIHDTGNFTRYERDIVRQVGEKLGTGVLTVFVNTPVKIARKRLHDNRLNTQRFNVTDEEFAEAVSEMEAPDDTETHTLLLPNDILQDWIDLHF